MMVGQIRTATPFDGASETNLTPQTPTNTNRGSSCHNQIRKTLTCDFLVRARLSIVKVAWMLQIAGKPSRRVVTYGSY